MSEKKKVRVSAFGNSQKFTVEDKNGEILYECVEPFRNWGIDRCAKWIKDYNAREEFIQMLENSLDEQPENKKEENAESK